MDTFSPPQTHPSKSSFRETAILLLQAFIVAFSIRLFLFQPFTIPSGSMIPTLLIGDYIFVNKLSYGYSRYSFNFSVGLGQWTLFSFGPLPFEGRVFSASPQRGDIVVFKLPKNPHIDYIKRVIGLPGDRVQMINGVLHLNGTPVKQEPMESYVGDTGSMQEPEVARRYRETLPNGVSYSVLDLTSESDLDNTQEFIVPPKHYFMMGDNRDNSADSRTDNVRFVPEENLVGKAKLVFFSLDPSGFLSIRFHRLLSWIS